MHPIEGDELRAIRRYLATKDDSLPWLFVSERQGRLIDSDEEAAMERKKREGYF